MDFVLRIYEVVSLFPDDEKYWLVSQLKRASVSIPSNIAEWAGRWWNQEFKQFLYISKWSCNEVETQLIIAYKLGFIWKTEFERLQKELEEIMKMLQGLINSKSKF